MNRKISTYLKPDKLNVLVVHSDPRTQRWVHYVLRRDYEIHHAYFGRAALSLMKRHDFGLVVASMDLPEPYAGVQMAEAIKAVPRCAYIPIIGLSADTDAADESLLKAAGLADYFAAPYPASAFYNAVRRELPLPLALVPSSTAAA